MTGSLQAPLFALVSLGIGHSVTSFPIVEDWGALMDVAAKQGLLGVALDGLDVLMQSKEMASSVTMDKALWQKWISFVIRGYEHRYQPYCYAVWSLARLFSSKGIKMMVLKGYACGMNWPKPEHRPYGDIDIWLFGQAREADRMLASEMRIRVEDHPSHHTVFRWKGVRVENHFEIFGTKFNRTNARMEHLFEELAKDDSNTTKVCGETVWLPSPNFHALFLVRHMALHFTSSGFILRQVLDWGFFVEKNSEAIDWDWLIGVIDEYGMTRFFDCLNGICVQELGFNPDLFPQRTVDDDLRMRVVNDIVDPEFKEEEPSGKMRRILFRIRRKLAMKWKHQLCSKESFWRVLAFRMVRSAKH